MCIEIDGTGVSARPAEIAGTPAPQHPGTPVARATPAAPANSPTEPPAPTRSSSAASISRDEHGDPLRDLDSTVL